MRMVLSVLGVVALLGVQLGCDCAAPAPCDQWSVIVLEGSGWPGGPARLTITHGTHDTLVCDFTSRTPGFAPEMEDLVCDGVAGNADVVLDTAGSVQSTRLELRRTVGVGDDVPAAVRVQIVDDPKGAAAVVLDTTTPIVWETRLVPPSRCAVDCRRATTVVDVP